MKPSARIRVRLKDRSYDVVVVCSRLNTLAAEIRRLRLGTDAVIVTNPTVLKSHGHARSVHDVLAKGGFAVHIVMVPDTEKSKSMKGLNRLLEAMAGLDRPGRKIFLVLVGGGVVGDLGGVAAGLYKRGVPFVQIPTTLLAQVDSSIGGKTAVDLPQGKNLIGLFNQPRLVFVDLAFLRSLPDRQFRSGMAEVAKCGVISDAVLFRFLENCPLSVLRFSEDKLSWVIARAIQVKVSVVERDEKELRGVRTLLNFGHTVGHALEAATNYSKNYTHGEAVAIGMCAATDVSLRLKMISSQSADRIRHLIRHLGLPTATEKVPLKKIFQAMSYDKKWMIGKNRLVLPTDIGRAVVVKGVPGAILRDVVKSLRED